MSFMFQGLIIPSGKKAPPSHTFSLAAGKLSCTNNGATRERSEQVNKSTGEEGSSARRSYSTNLHTTDSLWTGKRPSKAEASTGILDSKIIGSQVAPRMVTLRARES